jgi:hypothetical protein
LSLLQGFVFYSYFGFAAGFSHRSQPTSIDLNAVRLCFQVFIEDGEREKFTYPLTPVVSDPIYDKSKPWLFPLFLELRVVSHY